MKCPERKLKSYQDLIKGFKALDATLTEKQIENKAFNVWAVTQLDDFADWYGTGERDFAGNPMVDANFNFVNSEGETISANDLGSDSKFHTDTTDNEIVNDVEQEIKDYYDLILKAKDVLTKKIKIYRNSGNREHETALAGLREKIDKITARKAVALLIHNAAEEIRITYQKFTARQREGTENLRNMNISRNYVTAYDFLEQAQYLLAKNNELTPEEERALARAIQQKNHIKQAHKANINAMIATELAKHSKFSTREELEGYLKNAPFDVSWAAKWFDFIGDSKDATLPLIAKVVDDALQNTRKEHIAMRHELISLEEALARSKGNPSGDDALFHEMIERDINGKKTGYLVSEYRVGEFMAEMDTFREKMNAIEDKNSDEFRAAQKEYYTWLNKNTIQKYTPAFYDITKGLSPEAAEARETVNRAKREILRKYQVGKNNYNTNDITEEDHEKLRELQKKGLQLRNLFYVNGLKKSGVDLKIAQELNKLAVDQSEVYERIGFDKAGFDKAKKRAEQMGEEEYQKWLTKNTTTEFTQGFWAEFEALMNIIRDEDASIAEINEEMNSILREYKDENGIVNGEIVSPGHQKRIQQLTEDKKIIARGKALDRSSGNISADEKAYEEAKRKLDKLVKFKVTPYYDQVYKEMAAKGGKEFDDWFYSNHVYNNFAGNWEANRIWTTMQPQNPAHILNNTPNNTWYITDVKKEYWNPEYFNEQGDIIGTNDKGYALPTKRWKNKQFEDLMANPNKALLDYYKFYREKLKIADNKLPAGYRLDTKLPTIRKSTIDRIVEGGENAAQVLKESAKDVFVRRKDDTDMGQLENEAGEVIDYIPVYFTSDIPVNEMSFDMTTLLSSFYYMSTNHENLSKVIDLIEGAKFLIGDRTFTETDSMGKAMKNKLKGLISPERKGDGKASNAYAQLDQYLNMIVFGKMNDDLGFFDVGSVRLDRAKMADALSTYTAYSLLGLNFIAGTLNVAYGESMNWTEAFAGEFFTARTYGRANWEYDQSLLGIVGDIGRRVPKNKINLLNESLDTLNKYEEDVIHSEDNNRFKRLMKGNLAFFMSNAGEHMMQSKVMMSMLMNIKALDSNGKPIPSIATIWDGFSVKEGKLVLDEKVANFTDADQKRFTRQMQFVIRRMHGNYGKKTAAMWQSNAYLRMIGAMRKWVMPGFNRRWEGKRNNEFGEVVTEGMYRSTGRFVWQLIKDMRKLKLEILTADWKNLTDTEKQNIIRTVSEVGAFVLALSASTILFALAGGDDRDKRRNNQALLYMAYIALRLRKELTFYINPASTLQILRSPMASMSVIEAAGRLMTQFLNPTERYEVGYREGDLKLEKRAEDILPFWKHIKRTFTPDGLEDQFSWMDNN